MVEFLYGHSPISNTSGEQEVEVARAERPSSPVSFESEEEVVLLEPEEVIADISLEFQPPSYARHTSRRAEEADLDPFRKPPSAEVEGTAPSLSTVLNEWAILIRHGNVPLATDDEWNAGVVRSFQKLEEASRKIGKQLSTGR
jgi:hypothetical protein